MANLKVLENVIHQGIVLKKGIIVSDAERNLSSVAQSLVSRGLVAETSEAATHTLALVDNSQNAMPVTADPSEGQKPNADDDDKRKAEAKAAQEQADAETAAKVAAQAKEENQTTTVSQPQPEGQPKRSIFNRKPAEAPAAPSSETPANPTPEQVAETAANVQ